MGSHRSLLLCLVVVLALLQSSEQGYTLSSDNSAMNARAKITYYGYATGAYANTAKVKITFPSVFIITAADVAACVDVTSGLSASCTLDANNAVTFTLSTSFTYSDELNFYFYVKNPPYSEEFVFTSSVISSGGLTSSDEPFTSSALVTSSSLQSSSIAYTPKNTSTMSTFTFQFTTVSTVPPDGSLYIKFSYAPVNMSATLTLFNTTVMNSSVSGTAGSGSDGTEQRYIFPKIFNAGLAIGSVIKFSIGKVACPPTTDPTNYTVLVATTYTSSSSSIIDSSTFILNAVTDTTIVNPSGSISNFLVGENRVASLDFFTPAQIVWNTDSIFVTTDTPQSTYLTVSTSLSGFANYNVTGSPQLSIASATSGMKIYATGTAMSSTISAGIGVQFTAGFRVQSQISSGVKYFNVQLQRSGYSYASAGVPITVKPNTLNSVTYTTTNPFVSKTAMYTFTIRLKNPLGAQAAIKITLPSEMSIAVGSCVSTTTTSFSSFTYNQSCTASSSTSILITNLTNNVLLSNTSFSFTVAGINNPISTKTTATPFVVQTYYSSSEMGGAVDDTNSATLNSTLTVTASALVIGALDFNITRNSTTNLAYALNTITYRVNSKFKANGYITISFPSSVVLSASTTSKYRLTYANGTSTADSVITAVSTVNSTSGTNTVLFNFSSVITVDLATNTIFTFTIDSLQNYPSFKPISPQIRSFSNDGYSIEESSTSSISITNTVQNTALTIISTTANRMNGQLTTCTFQMTAPAPLASGSLITLELQNTNNVNTQMYLGSTFTCLVGGISATCSQDISNSRLLKITTGTSFSTNASFIISVSSIVLSRSFDVPGKIYFRVFQTVSTTNYNISSGTLTHPANSLTNAIKSLALNILDLGGAYPSQLNQLQTFQITITPTNRLQSGDVIVVSLPAEYSFVLGSTVGNASLTTGSLCTVSSDFHCSNNNSSPLFIRIVEKTPGTGFNNVSSVKITINNGTYRSPQLWTTFNSNIFLAYTYSSTGQPVDAVQTGSINTTFYLACTNTSAHCKTCTGTLCDTCYQVDSTGFAYGGYFYKTSTKECVMSCGGNFYNLSNTCELCISPCYGCSGTGTYCTSCVNSTYKLYNHSCLTGCPNGYYADSSNICQSCSANCLTCSVTSSNCTSCTGTYLSTVTSSCVNSAGCESYQYPDSSSFKCTNCSISCVGCTINSTMCKSSCATGYIIDIKYNTNNSFPAQCTNVCPDGTANDTSNSLGLGIGCRCNSSVCATCVASINTCLTCSGSLLLKNTSCLASCGSGYYASNGTCYSCPSTCSSCSSSTICTGCLLSEYWVYNGLCINICPNYTTKAVLNGSYTCITCSSGCSSCQTATFCISCLSPNYIENINGNQYCTSSCSVGKYLSGTSCVSNCPTGYIASAASVCIVDNSTISNSTITNTLTSSSSRFIPFPATIGLLVLSITTLASKVALPYTIVPAALSAFGGLVQIIAWFIFIIAAGVNSSSSYPLTNSGMIIVVISLIINWGLNALSLYFFKKYIWDDNKFQGNLKKLRNKTKTGVCVTYTCFIVSAVLSHKFIQILFSNLFEAGYFIFKVEDKVKLTPLNYIRYVSLVASILAIVGAAVANYENQTLSMDSFVFIQSIDLIIVTLLAAIASLWATARKADDYQNNISEKRNDMEEELEHDPIEDDANHFEKEAKLGNSRSKYIHTSMTNKMGDPRDNPLNPRHSSRVNPIGVENNYTNMPLDNKDDDELNRINLNDMSNVTRKNRKRIEDGLDLDEIQLEENTGDELLPRKTKGRGKGSLCDRHKSNNNGISNRYTKMDPNSPTEQEKEKKKLKDNIENQLSADEIQRTKVIKDVDEIDVNLLEQGSPRQKTDGSQTFIKQLDKNGIKKQKLETLSNIDADKLNKLPQSERGKAGQIKSAMSLLQAKKVNIGQYLEYLDIIEEQDEDKNSDDYDDNRKNRRDRKKGGKRGDKGVKKDKTQRKIDKDLFIHQNDTYDDEPKIPDFNHHSPIRARNPTDAGDMSQFDDFHRLSSLKKSGNNRSEQMFKKNKNGIDDLVLISHQSGENQDLSLGEEFQRGNTLQPVDKDELPPSNLYQTQKMTQDGKKGLQNSVPIGKNRIVPNHLLYDGDHIQFVQSEGADNETVKGDIVDFNNDVSPSQFNEPNLRIQSDEISDAPTKPRLTKRGGNEVKGKKDNNAIGKKGAGFNGKDEALQIEDIQNDQDEFDRQQYNDMPSRMNRYQSNRVLDYDEILQNKKQNEKMKKLEQIYLPRINVNKNQNKKKKNNYSSHSFRRDDLK